jgi:hypothetical protein
VTFADIERKIVDYFESTGCDIEQDGVEWFLSLYDEGPSISLTALAIALSSTERTPQSVLSTQNVGQSFSKEGQLLSENHERSADEGRTNEERPAKIGDIRDIVVKA